MGTSVPAPAQGASRFPPNQAVPMGTSVPAPAQGASRFPPNQAADSNGAPLTSGHPMAAKAGRKAISAVKEHLSHAVPACQSAGEFALPLELAPLSGGSAAESLPAILKNGFAGLAGGFKRTLGDKKRLAIAIALTVVWLLVNLLSAFDIFPVPVRALSWLTAARGSLMGGSVGKGLVAALLARIVADPGMPQGIKGGLGQMRSALKGGKSTHAPLLFGAGAALIACNLMVSSRLQNTMVCAAGFALSAKALTQNGFLRRLASALLPNTSGVTVPALMSGWTLGFALFAAVCLIPGGKNGILAGMSLLIAGCIVLAVGNRKQEVTLK